MLVVKRLLLLLHDSGNFGHRVKGSVVDLGDFMHDSNLLRQSLWWNHMVLCHIVGLRREMSREVIGWNLLKI